MIFPSAHRRGERIAAESLYAAIVAAARHPVLYSGFGVPDTPDGRFEMIALHFRPVVHRLMERPEGDAAFARLLSEVFVADLDSTLREMGVGDLSVPKRVKALYSSFAGRLTAYRAAAQQGEDVLAAAIERNVFPQGGGRAALALARYLLAATAAFEGATAAELRRAEAPYPDPASYLQDGATP